MTASSSKPNRLLFIDNIRVFLTILVILHHLMITYGGEEIGGWIYFDYRPDAITAAVGNWFTGLNQSYFMGLFLFISAYFVPGAYDRKGAGRFLKDRLIRLGIPLVLYAWIIRPLWYFNTFHVPGTYWNWFFGDYLKYYGYIGGGPLWFIEVLLIFACFYVLYRKFKPQPVQPMPDAKFPSSGKLILFAFLLGIVAAIVQIWFPRDTTITELNLQLANFPQYIVMFILGLMAYPRNWFASLPDQTARRWMIVVFMLSFLPLLVGFAANPQAGSAMDFILNLVSNWWESFMCVGMSITVVYLFRRHFNRQERLAAWASRNAYAAYLIHEPIIATAALLLTSVILHPLLKFALMGLVTVPLTFLLSALIRKIPYTDRVL
jgi:surface polysaccharide O-acyltransferase-like enzyme